MRSFQNDLKDSKLNRKSETFWEKTTDLNKAFRGHLQRLSLEVVDQFSKQGEVESLEIFELALSHF